MDICLVEKDIKEIELMRPLWEQLNSIHFPPCVLLTLPELHSFFTDFPHSHTNS
jgi:hypothetical protein